MKQRLTYALASSAACIALAAWLVPYAPTPKAEGIGQIEVLGTIQGQYSAYVTRWLDTDEVRQLLTGGLPRDATALQAIGFKQFLAVADGTATEAEAVEEVKLRSRQYAKRQLTWLRRNPDIFWVRWQRQPNFPEGLQKATEYLHSRGLC